MKKLILALILGAFLISLVSLISFISAEQMVGNDSDEHGCKASAGYSWCESKEKCIRSWETNCSAKEENNGLKLGHEGNKLKIHGESESADADNLNITEENETDDNGNNKTKLKIHLSNGFNSEIKIMPETASAKALEVLGAKCAERNCTIELKEVGNGNQTKAAYEVTAEKDAKLLGFIKTKMKVQAQIDAETGDVIKTKKPWWRVFASEQS